MEWNCNWRVWEDRDWTFNGTARPASCKISRKLGEIGLNGITLVVNFTLRLTLDDYSTITRVIYISFDAGRRC